MIIAHITVVGFQMIGTRGDHEKWHPNNQMSYVLPPTDTWQKTNEAEHHHNNSLEELAPFDPTQNPQRQKRKM